MADIVTVINAGDEPKTEAEILIRNQLSYMPKVSVIIPVYNVAKYLRQCLDSVINQTLKEIEIICVDDGSTDESLDILKEYAVADRRIMVLTQKNLFAGIARNAGFAVATGEYVCFWDSDDFFEHQMLEKMFFTAQKDGSDVVVCGYSEFDDVAQKDVNKYFIRHDFVRSSPFWVKRKKKRLNSIHPAPWNKLFKADLFQKYGIRFENLRSCNDLTAVLSALVVADKISALKDLFVHYRVNTKGQISANRGRNAKCVLYALDRLEKNLKRFGVRDVFQYFLAKVGFACLRYEKTCCNEEQLQELVCAIPEVLSSELCSDIEVLNAQRKKCVRWYYLFGVPVLKICE